MKGIAALNRISVSKILLLAFLTAVLLVASISVGGKPAQAQTAAQTVADLLDGVSIPGLDSLPVSNLQSTDSYKSADITVHGQTATIVIFKPSNADKNVVAVVPNNFSLSDFVPLPSGTPLDDVTFSDMAFIIAQTNISLAKADAPKPLKAALSHGGDTVTLKQGVNLFGEADFSASGTVKDLLSAVGITNMMLPLNGSLPTNLFSQNPKTAAQNFKNQILDNLDISLPLPTLSIPGVPDAVSFTNTKLAIKVTNDSGMRTIEVDVTGELDVSVAGNTVDFDFEVDVKKQAGKAALINITGSSVPGTTLSVNLVETFTLSNLGFQASNNPGHWVWQIGGDTTFRSKQVSVNYLSSKQLLIGVNMTLADIAGHPDLPVLSDIKTNLVVIMPNAVRVGMEIKGVLAELDMWKPQGAKKYYTGFAMGDFSPADLIPGAESTPLKDVEFKKLVFINNPTGAEQQVAFKDLPDEVGYHMSFLGIEGTITLKKGLNVYGNVDITPSGEMATLLKKVGISELKLPLNGTFSPKALAKNHGSAAIRNAILDNLDLHLPLPTPSIPGLSNALTFNNGKMHIKGKLPDGTQGISVEVSGDADVKFGSHDSLAFTVDVTYERATGGTEKELRITGSTTAPWNDPFGMTWIDLTNLSVTFDETNNNGQKKWTVAVTAKSTIGHHSNLDITVNVTEENGVLTDATFTLDGPLDLSEVPGLKDIPEVNDLIIKSLTASSHGIEAKTMFNKKETDFFAFEDNDKWVIALMQKDFSLTELVPKLAKTPLKDIVLSEAAIVVTQAQVNGKLSSYGPVAQDAFEDIYQITAANGLDPQINIAEGLNLIAAFEHSKSTGTMKGGMTSWA